MSEEMIIRHCSPTLAGIKTGNMFTSPYRSVQEMRADIRGWNRLLSAKGLCVLPLKYNGRNALIYIYRPAMLSKDLADSAAHGILKKCGYRQRSSAECIAQLRKRMASSKEFPHEVGLFLGYPPEDVNGFIENKSGRFKCVGCWKVYGDEEKAKRIFRKYNKCTRIYSEQHANGKGIERLTVAG